MSDQPLVLYVDDERGNRVVFEQSFGGDFNVQTVDDAASALAVFDEREVGVLVTDMRMPTMDGDELLGLVKERWPQTIRIVVTAFADVEPILRAINDGLVARYIIKPWVNADIVQILRWATEASTLGKTSAPLQRRLMETERLATIGSVSGMLVHDLKQPLMSLMLCAEILGELAGHAPLLQRGLAHGSSDPRAIALLQDLGRITSDIQASVDQLNTSISGLHGFSKRRTDGRPLASDPMPSLRHAMAVCRELAVDAEIVRDDHELPRLRIQPAELTQILVSLVANAAQAVEGRANGKVTIDVHEDRDDMLAFVIRDNGPGMPPEILGRIGTPFFTTRADGIGLGIANCQRVVGAVGGQMRIESKVGVGTTVQIRLPIATD